MRQTLTDDFWGLHKNMMTNFVSLVSGGVERGQWCKMDQSLHSSLKKICRSSLSQTSSKQVFLKISQISRETPVLEYLFNKVANLRHLLLQNTSGGCFWNCPSSLLRWNDSSSLCKTILLPLSLAKYINWLPLKAVRCSGFQIACNYNTNYLKLYGIVRL